MLGFAQNADFTSIDFTGTQFKPSNMNNAFNGCPADVDISGFDISAMTTATACMQGSNFSTANFDKLLAALYNQPVQDNVPFHAGTAKYSNQTHYDHLTITNNWTITSGGPV
jgi:hypothetical protein